MSQKNLMISIYDSLYTQLTYGMLKIKNSFEDLRTNSVTVFILNQCNTNQWSILFIFSTPAPTSFFYKILNCRLGNWKHPNLRWPHLCLSANTDVLKTNTTEITSCLWSTNCVLCSFAVSAVPVQWIFTSTLEACRNNNIWQMMTWLWAKFNQTCASCCNKFFHYKQFLVLNHLLSTQKSN